jgi:uncharacterized damage-inducible protein DinB
MARSVTGAKYGDHGPGESAAMGHAMSQLEHYRAMARNNAWSNHRLLKACADLTPAEFGATRTSFFPSLRETLNHILTVDWYYLDALEQQGRGLSVFDPEIPFPDAAQLWPAQAEADRRLIAFCERVADADLERIITIDRGPQGLKPNSVAAFLSHLFVHQIHHRGQAHAMLAGTNVAPPQLDEFFLAEDAPLRAADLAALGLKGP